MSESPSSGSVWRSGPEAVGRGVVALLLGLVAGISYFGQVVALQRAVGVRVRTFHPQGERIRLAALVQQSVRVGVRSIPIVALVQLFIGVILALNLAPVLESYGQIERVADVVAIAVIRELGPLITAILLSGFAGASIAAEIGAMVEGEEIKALRAHALDPIRFLIAPRIIATTVMMVGLSVMADVLGVMGGMLTAVGILGISPLAYLDLTRGSISFDDYFTGLLKALVFGLIIASLACHEGLRVSGGAEGVGRATTTTVVKSIVALIAADTVFAGVFYVIGW